MCSDNGAAILGITSLFIALLLSFLVKEHVFLFLSPISDLLCVVLIWLEIETVRFLLVHVLVSHLLSLLLFVPWSFESTFSKAVPLVLFSKRSFCDGFSFSIRRFSSTASCEWSKHFVDFCNNRYYCIICYGFTFYITWLWLVRYTKR